MAALASNTNLVKQVDALLDDEEETVILALRLAKNQASWTVAGRRGRLQSKPRVIAVSVRRHAPTQKYKVKVHIIKPMETGMELVKSHRLQSLTTIQLVPSDTTGRSFLLVFDDKKESTQPQWTTRTVDDRNQLLVCFLKMARENLKSMPRVIGIDVVEMALWAKNHARALPLGAPGGGLDGREEGMDEGERRESEGAMMMGQDSMVTKGEEEDMETLLSTYVIGIDEAEAFSERLKRELGALEAANVHAILESETLVEEVLDKLDEASESVDDMEEWLTMYNIKLRHMREDIEAIEAQNNMLEVQAVNNNKLVAELEPLLDSLFIPSQCSSVLSSAALDESSLPEVLEALDWLDGASKSLEPPQLNPTYDQLKVVVDKRAELRRLRTNFIRRAVDFLRSYFSALIDAAMGRGGSKGPPDHRDLRRKCGKYMDLVSKIKDLDPASMSTLRKAYSQSLNLLIRREAREFSMDLRSSARVQPKPSATLGPFAEQSAHAGAGGGAVTNAESAPVSDAYAKMLRTFLPLISEEAVFFKEFLCFSQAPPSEEESADGPGVDENEAFAAATEELFDGIQEDFFSLVDWAFKVDPLRCISLAGQTESWQSSLDHKGGDQDPSSHITRKLLLELQTRIGQHFFKYVEEANSQIERYDRGVKQAGVMSYIPKFALLAVRMEGLISNNSRDLVDQAYRKLVATMFNTLDKISQLDPKHADVLLLENFAAFQNSTYDLAGSIPSLRSHYQLASDSYELACNRYIDGVIMTQFDKLFEYYYKIKGLLGTIETEEIPFQIGFSKVDLRKVLKSQLTGADRSLAAMYQRIRKNLTSLDLLQTLWEKCEESFMEKYEDLEGLVQRCYGNERISPSASEMRNLFVSVAG